MSREDDPDEIEYDSMEEFLNEHDDTPALPEPTDEERMEAWDDADPEDHLPTIPGTTVLDTVEGSTYLWDSECNEGLRFDGELMAREDGEFAKANA